jgi:hypothetical protein
VARKFALEAELSSALKSFYCELCDKQFKTVAQYDEHTNSYAHHHKARFKNMQANNRIKPQELDKRQEKERKREEKELRKIAAANGIKMPKAQTATLTQIAVTDLSNNIEAGAMRTEPTAEISGDTSNSTMQSGGFRRSGWNVVGAATTSTPQPPPSLPPPLPSPGPPPPIPARPPQSALQKTSFLNAGWTTLETAHTHDMLMPSTAGWPTNSLAATEALQPPRLSPGSVKPPLVAVPDAKPVRSNWQQFQKGKK